MPTPARPARPATIRQGDRDKAYRPLPLADRRAAFDAALAAYGRGDFFAAHEALEPAWMGTDDLAERALHQGLIKLAAAYVHAVRGNPTGVAKNLDGARRHLAQAGAAGFAWGVDVAALLADIEARLADPTLVVPPPAIRRIAPA
jgi:predicted metal-dependent hydrolase